MWRCDVANVQYVSLTWEGLVGALGSHKSLSVHTPAPPVVVESDGIRVSRILRDHVSPLWQKQAAWHEAKQLVHNMDTEIQAIGEQMKSKLDESFNARSFARKMGKSFDEVTYDDLVQHEHNLVRRNALIRELAERLQCK